MSMKRGAVIAAAIGVAVSAGLLSGAGATEEALPTGQALVDARVQNLKDAGDAMKAIGGFAQGQGTAEAAKEAAAYLVEVGAAIPLWFPAGSGPGGEGITKTRALAKIWETNEDFVAKSKAMEDAAKAIQAALEAGSDGAAVGTLLKAAGDTCKACHTDYRGPEQ
jgi:cytochrome c556